jgi:drug/metabolite transporter (DMT)-like permease
MNWIVLTLVSAVLFAAANIIRKHVLNKEHSIEFLAARGFFVIPILLLLAPWIDTNLDLRILILIYVASLVATVGYYYQTKAQRHCDISYLSPLQNLSPLFLFFIAYLFLHETVNTVQILGILAVVIGSYTLAIEPHDNFLGPLRQFRKDYWMHIMVAVVLLAVAVALDKYLVGLVRPVTYLFFVWLFMSLNYIIFDWFAYGWKHILVDFQKGWHWLFLAAVCVVISMLFFYTAISLPGVLVTLALPLRRVSTLLETLFGGTLFHEKNLPRRLLACLITLVGVVLLIR